MRKYLSLLVSFSSLSNLARRAFKITQLKYYLFIDVKSVLHDQKFAINYFGLNLPHSKLLFINYD